VKIISFVKVFTSSYMGLVQKLFSIVCEACDWLASGLCQLSYCLLLLLLHPFKGLFPG